jgi:LPS export ABC transporter protein LptC
MGLSQRARAHLAFSYALAAILAAAPPQGWAVAAAAESPRATPAPSTPSPLIEIGGSEIVGTTPTGRRQWEIRAAGVTVDDRQARITFDRVRGRFFPEKDPPVNFEADAAQYDTKRRYLVLTGRVRAAGAPDGWLTADRAEYDARTEHLIATGNVRLRNGVVVASGSRLTSDVALRRSRLVGDVRIDIRAGGGRTP